MLELEVDITIIPDDDEPTVRRSATGRALLMRICHPEASNSGTCPECWQHNGRIFDPERANAGIDGLGPVPPIPLHQNCKCEDIDAAEAAGFGIEPQKRYETLKGMSAATLASVFGATAARAIASGAARIEDAYIVRRGGRAIKANLNQMASVIEDRSRAVLRERLLMAGASLKKIDGLSKAEMTAMLMQLYRRRRGIK